MVLFDEAAEILARGVCRWTGIPWRRRGAALASDLVAMVDGFATPGRGTGGPGPPARAARRGWAASCGTCATAWPPLPRARRSTSSPTTATPTANCSIRTRRRWSCSTSSGRPRPCAGSSRSPPTPCTAGRGTAPLREGDDAFAEAFTHEVRRFYPFAPFLGGRAVRS
nr:hypothetical protein GCM10020093_009320 [Planobispora longispora]